MPLMPSQNAGWCWHPERNGTPTGKRLWRVNAGTNEAEVDHVGDEDYWTILLVTSYPRQVLLLVYKRFVSRFLNPGDPNLLRRPCCSTLIFQIEPSGSGT